MANAHSSYLFTSESVTEGHPDKVCDQISDAVLDAILEKEIELAGQGYVSPSGQPADPTQVRCACETMATTGMIIVAGEIRTQAYVDVPALAREVLREIGYDRAKYGFDCDTCGVLNAIHDQSPDIAQGVDESYEAQHGQAGDDPYEKVGAGDQGMMFGYACDETSTLMPMPIYLAQRMAEQLAAVRKDGTMPYLRPDGKTQVSVRYIDDKPVNVEKVVVSTQHSEEISTEQLRAEIEANVIRPVLEREGVELAPDAGIHINPTGRFVTAAAHSRAKTARRSTALRHTPPAGSPRTWLRRVWRTVARCRWLTPSAWLAPCPSWSTRSVPSACPWPTSSAPSTRCSTCVPAPSSTTWTCAVPSIARRPPTATSAASFPSSPGRQPTARTPCARPAVWSKRFRRLSAEGRGVWSAFADCGACYEMRPGRDRLGSPLQTTADLIDIAK